MSLSIQNKIFGLYFQLSSPEKQQMTEVKEDETRTKHDVATNGSARTRSETAHVLTTWDINII